MCNKEKFWPILVRELGETPLSDQDRFGTFAKRLENKAQLDALLESVLQQHETSFWLSKFEGKVPVAPVYDVAQALDNPFFLERGGMVSAESPEGESYLGVASPIRCPGVDLPRQAAPSLGGDTLAILHKAGLTAAQIEYLKANKVV